MTANRRIALNVVATYGRSLYALVIGLFCGRWTLMALGEVDYGLMGVVGGLTAFIAFLNAVLAGSVSRYYAFSVGAAQKTGNDESGLAECRRWFTVAISIHTVVPLGLMAIGYPLGVWAIRDYLTIPADRISDCIWVFRFVCASCFVSMVSVPLQAMYTAKQYIAELTVYSLVTSTLNVFFLYYVVSHPGVWLVRFSAWTCLLTVVPALVITVRACLVFPECRILPRSLYCWRDIRGLLSFAGWSFFGALGILLKGQGVVILVNKMLGPVFNASMSVANTISGQAQTLSGAMVGAFMPAITTARGAEDRERMVSLVHKTCKFGALLVLPFAIPMALEMDEVMVLWLKNPPPESGCLCIWLMAILVLENMTTGHWVAISANGRIAWYQVTVGILFVATLPIAWAMMACGLGIRAVGYALIATLLAVVAVRIATVRFLLGILPRYWIFRILLPVVGVTAVTTLVGGIAPLVMAPSFWRVVVTTVLCEAVFLPLAFFCVLDRPEREFVLGRLRVCLDRIGGHHA